MAALASGAGDSVVTSKVLPCAAMAIVLLALGVLAWRPHSFEPLLLLAQQPAPIGTAHPLPAHPSVARPRVAVRAVRGAGQRDEVLSEAGPNSGYRHRPQGLAIDWVGPLGLGGGLLGALFARTRTTTPGLETLSLSAAADGTPLAEQDPEMFAMCQEVYNLIEEFSFRRGMSYNELKLIIGIESPEAKAARAVGLEDDSGCSRADLLAALEAVKEGRFPEDRLSLETLLEELRAWDAE
eukprot:EG_transcript_22030